MRRIAKKAGLKLVNKSGTKLKDILGAPNKTKIDPQQKKGVYCHQCPCDTNAKYVGMTKDRRHDLMKGVPTSTPTPLDVDLRRTDPTWPHVDLDLGRPDMKYYLQQLFQLFQLWIRL